MLKTPWSWEQCCRELNVYMVFSQMAQRRKRKGAYGAVSLRVEWFQGAEPNG